MFPNDFEVHVAPAHWREEFASWLREGGRSVNTISAYLQDLAHFERYFSEVSAQNVRTYFRMQDVDNTVKPASRNRRLASLRVFVKWAVEAGYLEADPTIGVKRVEVELSPRDRTRGEMSSLEAVAAVHGHLRCETEAHAQLGYRDAVIWSLMEMAGLRVSEVADLKVSDVDLDGKVIHVLGKGGKKADVQIPQALVDVIASWLTRKPVSKKGHLVTDWNGYGLSRGQVWRRLKLMGEKAGVEDIRPHDVRHTFVYRTIDTAVSQGMAIPVAFDAARKQARHGDVRTTQKFYLHARASDVRAVVEAM